MGLTIMPEKEFPAKIVVVDYVCDECGEGHMVRKDNIVLTSYPPQYQHVCTNCEATENFTTVYPTQRTVRLTETEILMQMF